MVMDGSLSWTVDRWRIEQLRLLSLTINFHRIDARNSPKQAKKIILSACASIYREICLSRRETVRLN